MVQDFFVGLWNNVLSQPMLQLVAMVVPLAILARWMRTTPTIWLALSFAALMPVPVIGILLADAGSMMGPIIALMMLALIVGIFSLVQFLAHTLKWERFQLSFPPISSRVWLGMTFMSLLAICVLFAFATVGHSLVWVAWTLVGLNLLIVLIAAIDLASLPRAKDFSVERETTRIASLLKKQKVVLTVTYKGPRSLHLSVRDDVPQQFQAVPEEFNLDVEPRSRTTVHYEMEPTQRGSFAMDTVYIQVDSKLRFWKKIVKVPAHIAISVYPDMKQLAEYALLARTNRLSLVGVRRTRKVGQDHDFERLRDYTRDDNYKHIDWRSTARRRRLTVREFQTSQSQRIMFMIDCGRMMTNEADGISLLDHAFNAMLMLSFVALRQGDSVGAIAFSDRVHKYVPPKSGANQMNHLLHASYDQFPNLVESRYDEAFMHLRTNCRKRSLVVLITNVIDEVNSHQVEQYLTTLVGRHLPLGVLLRDHRLFDAADNEKPYGPELFRAAAAAEILTWRHHVLTDLSHKGVLAMDVFPEDLTANLVNQYLEIKARHLL
ncbi:DUF58 domain-containing protein [Bremerella sp. T1]|uniref:DUF58 domain-containing protein n=1 Tax=Bremerella sp. TYQ1 TaxID=3119568 RepID=UPI001CCA39D2|nr:DUF58 domain-containing protein [Bremerella volcania]UBM38881.1 DUF58 domain-containing protein [Bremerella volcania]